MTAEQERARLLKSRLDGAGLRKVAATLPEVPWRSHGVVLQVILFVLTCAGLAAMVWLLDEMELPRPGLFAGVIALAIAEMLIRKLRWFGTGVEAALWIGGLIAMITELPSSGSAESILVIGAAFALAGFRVRNPILGAAAAVCVVLYFEDKADLGVIAGLVIATIAALALLRTWRRPSTEWLWIWIALAAPVAGRFEADDVWRTVTIILYFGYALLALALAIRKRHHALFVSSGIALAIAAVDLGRTIPPAAEVQLAVAGALLLIGAWLTARRLRAATTGLVTTPSTLTGFDDALEIVGTIHLPRPEFEPAAVETEGGKFGGAGATGSY